MDIITISRIIYVNLLIIKMIIMQRSKIHAAVKRNYEKLLYR